MTKVQIIARLRKMLDDIEAMPESLVGDDIYPLLRVTYIERNSTSLQLGERITLIVGATVEDEEQ